MYNYLVKFKYSCDKHDQEDNVFSLIFGYIFGVFFLLFLVANLIVIIVGEKPSFLFGTFVCWILSHQFIMFDSQFQTSLKPKFLNLIDEFNKSVEKFKEK